MGSLRERCARVFEVCDEGNKGYLNREDFEVAVVMLFGYELSEVEVDSIMSSVRPENSGILFEKFLNLMSARKSAQLCSDETREIFTAFDMQDRGFLTFEDFKKTFNSVLPRLSERIIIEAFSRGPQVLACALHLNVPCCALLLRAMCLILEELCCEASIHFIKVPLYREKSTFFVELRKYLRREVDQDSDGRISFKEFECAMKHGQDEVSPLYFA